MVKVKGNLIINSRGGCRFVKNRVGINWDEVLMAINVEIPDSVFKRPILEANIKIDGELNQKLDYELKEDLNNVLESLPNIHLTKINIIKEDD